MRPDAREGAHGAAGLPPRRLPFKDQVGSCRTGGRLSELAAGGGGVTLNRVCPISECNIIKVSGLWRFWPLNVGAPIAIVRNRGLAVMCNVIETNKAEWGVVPMRPPVDLGWAASISDQSIISDASGPRGPYWHRRT